MIESTLGAWTPADGPLDRPQTPSPTIVVAVGVGMIMVSVALIVAGVVRSDKLVGRVGAILVLILLILVIGALGAALLASYPRVRAARFSIGPEGIAATHASVQTWSWEEIERVAVEVLLRREVLELGPKETRTNVWIQIGIRPRADALARRTASRTLPRSPRWRPYGSSPTYPYLIKVTAPMFSSGENIPIVRDIDAALRAYAGSRYLGVQQRLRYTP